MIFFPVIVSHVFITLSGLNQIRNYCFCGMIFFPVIVSRFFTTLSLIPFSFCLTGIIAHIANLVPVVIKRSNFIRPVSLHCINIVKSLFGNFTHIFSLYVLAYLSGLTFLFYFLL